MAHLYRISGQWEYPRQARRRANDVYRCDIVIRVYRDTPCLAVEAYFWCAALVVWACWSVDPTVIVDSADEGRQDSRGLEGLAYGLLDRRQSHPNFILKAGWLARVTMVSPSSKQPKVR